MSKTKDEMFQKMLRLQAEEDMKVHREFGITYEKLLNEHRYFYALLDELGELNHELKSEWCWWKKNVSEVDRAKVVEEFSDVTHFILSFCIAYTLHRKYQHISSIKCPAVTKESLCNNWFPGTIISALHVISNCIDPVDFLLARWNEMIIMLHLDFEKDVYEPYLKKNAINQQRVKDGY